jgi:thymidylate synthase (FAD)
MTLQSEVLDDPNYIPCLDYGFTGIVDSMGDDHAIANAARVSYGKGTKSVRGDKSLIRYLVRHFHTSPIEMAEVKFHLKLPIFVMRQLVRHRTASLNEYSGRYSEMSNEFYIPEMDVIQPQSTDNKQGRAGEISDQSKNGVRWLFKALYEVVYDGYQTLLGSREAEKFIQGEPLYDAYGSDDPLLDENYAGLTRELSRAVLSVGNYTECYFKMDLSNILKMLKLRMDGHAQYEIRVFANAMYNLIKPLFPATCEAAEDYLFQSYTLSRMETNIVKDLLAVAKQHSTLVVEGKEKEMAEAYGMSERELTEFRTKFEI